MDRKTTSVTSCANDTKWRELRQTMAAHNADAPYWRTRDLPSLVAGTWQIAHEPDVAVASPAGCDDRWDGEWWYHFRSENTYARIEWCDMQPKPHPCAMPLETIVAICEAIGFEYELHAEFLRAFGYRRTIG